MYKHNIQDQVRYYVLHNFNEIAVVSQELLYLSCNNLYDIINDNFLNMKDEEPIWECCLRWIAYDEENRIGFTPKLLEGIRLGLMDIDVNTYITFKILID